MFNIRRATVRGVSVRQPCVALPWQGARCLARALRANNTLNELDLRWNEVGNDGARALRDSLETNRALTSIKLSGNKVCIEGESPQFLLVCGLQVESVYISVWWWSCIIK